MPYLIVALITLALWVFCLIDVITAPESGIRHLPKGAWLLVILFVPTVGALLWLILGRPYEPPRPRSTTAYPEYDRPGRYIPRNPDDEEFLRALRARAEQQRAEAKRQEEARQRDLELRRQQGEQVD
ncbi:PLDc N-terminal domain-containing protein [Nocardia otitidiscaviarum]|uniref:PLD nuclease N-terminal domain-containing protein n=1 Tax=Nocardia otitidiscaviarum TaxID=1823 RepID=UPI0004A73EB3|nr:PLD nuclease N-terminal domain-containing protein [Nocardia otitidiscaviarum]MBF6135573.1 PLDc N-terminal domain-containing protein [Nocardia otitidiscaviarum]MBF6487390.1 PLDc N-terminal domain-containing protein [Nocardia otitidiscaviarum]